MGENLDLSSTNAVDLSKFLESPPRSTVGVLSSHSSRTVETLAHTTSVGCCARALQYNDVMIHVRDVRSCCFFECRSIASVMSRVISSVCETPDASQSMGYMLTEVNPGIVFSSLMNNVFVSR